MIALVMQRCAPAAVEDALGLDARRLLPEALRLVELRARIPRYQRDMLRYAARVDGTSVDVVLSGQLDDLAAARADEFAAALPSFREAMAWPARHHDRR
jgi:hypothetical protein